MIEEREFRAVHFWRDVDSRCRTEFSGSDDDYVRASLMIYFVATWRYNDKPIKNAFLDNAASRLANSNDRDFSGYWRSLFTELASMLGGDRSLHPSMETVNSRFFKSALEVMNDHFTTSDVHKADYFDYRFLTLAERVSGANRRLSHLCAVLSNTLAEKADFLVDAFCTSGEMFATTGGERWRLGNRRRTFSIVRQVGSMDLELRMRLFLHGIDPLENLISDQWVNFSHSNAFIQINGPSGGVVPKRLNPREVTPENATTAISMLDTILDRYGSFDGVVIVAGAQRTTLRNDSVQLREKLITSGVLSAVVDLPSLPGTGLARSAWILQKEPHYNRRILMLDLRSLGVVRSNHEFGVIAEFAGRLIQTFYEIRYSHRWASLDAGGETDRLRQIFEREFGGGYRDVEGLCRAVDREEVFERKVSLVASTFIRQPERPAWLSGIDGSAVVNQLAQPGQGRSIYIIGNNGEGKSLLLRELAEFSSKNGRKTVGISFGTTDRFEFGTAENPELTQFNYEGARTSVDGSNSRKAANDICIKMLNIHRAPERLIAFKNALSMLEFDAQRFILPFVNRRAIADAENELEQMLELTDDVRSNIRLTEGIKEKSHQVAFMRRNFKGGITPFSELSSGEQQMLALTIKIIASAEPESLMLVDEPEISLHVSWQRLLPTLLAELGDHFRCDIVVATHSPLVISSATRSRDICFVARRRQLESIALRDRHSVESILFTGFDTHTENNRQVHERCAVIVAQGISAANRANFETQEFEKLIDELANMRRTVLSSKGQIASESLEASLNLISKTREALAQMASWQQEEIDGEGQV